MPDVVQLQTLHLWHNDHDIRLAADDGSSTFRADATFRQVPGFADVRWTSVRSSNYPDRYLRHYNSVLRIDPISSTVDKQDATFRITC